MSESDHEAGCSHSAIRLSDRFDQAIGAIRCRTQVDHQNLVLTVMNDVGQFRSASEQVGGGQLAFEDAVLEVITPIAKAAKHVAQSLGITDVVSNQIDSAHGELLFLFFVFCFLFFVLMGSRIGSELKSKTSWTKINKRHDPHSDSSGAKTSGRVVV